MNRFFGFALAGACALLIANVGPAQSSSAPQWVLTLSASPAAYVGPCPAKIALKGLIRLNSWAGATPVNFKYSLLNNDGIDSFLMNGSIAAVPGSYTVTDGRTPSASGNYWVQLLLHQPVTAASNHAEFSVKCTNRVIGIVPNPNKTPNPNATPTTCPPTVPGCPPPPTATPCPPSAAGVPCHPNPNATPTPCRLPSGAPCPPCPPGIANFPCHPNPNATPTPCVNPLNNAPCSPPPCHDRSGQPIPCRKLPDLTAGPTTILGGDVGGGPLPSGGVGRVVSWGTTVGLTDRQAFLISNGHCAFNIAYRLENIGGGNAGPPDTAAFKDVIRSDGGVVSIQSALSQAAGTGRVIHTQAYLQGGGPHVLSLTINDGHAAPESNYANNYFTLKYTIDSDKCR